MILSFRTNGNERIDCIVDIYSQPKHHIKIIYSLDVDDGKIMPREKKTHHKWMRYGKKPWIDCEMRAKLLNVKC